MGNCDPSYVSEPSKQNGLPHYQSVQTTVHRPAPYSNDQLYEFSYKEKDGYMNHQNNHLVTTNLHNMIGRSQFVHLEPEPRSQFKMEKNIQTNGTKDLAYTIQHPKVTNITFDNNTIDRKVFEVKNPIQVKQNYYPVKRVQSQRVTMKVGSPPLNIVNGPEAKRNVVFNYASQQKLQKQPFSERATQIQPQQVNPILIQKKEPHILPNQVPQRIPQVLNSFRSEQIPVINSIIIPKNPMPSFNQILNNQAASFRIMPANDKIQIFKSPNQTSLGPADIPLQLIKPKQEINSNIQKQEVKGEKPMAEASKPNQKQVVRKERDHLEPKLNFDQDFLTHHLKYQLSLTKMTSMRRIRRRQILQHIYSESNWLNFRGPRDLNISWSTYFQSLMPAWIQHTFLDIWQQAHDDFFNKHLDYKYVRRKIAEQYLHELYQLKQFAQSSMVTLNFFYCDVEVMFQSFMQYSDDALLNLFKKLKERYPQTTAKQKIEFPDVPTTKTSMNLFDNFTALSFSDPKNLNYQTIYQDINFLLKRAAQEQADFKNDMKEILGDDVLGCTKVGRVVKDGKSSFNACAVRRVFVKWAQNLLQKCPDLYHTRSFMKFIQSRGRIVNNFIFKSTVTATTHKIVIDTISLLLQVAKFNLKDVTDPKKREEFIFNIYDLLRCKIKRGTPTQIVALLQKMQSTSITKSGKKFQVIRVKNRFKTNNRDLLINFRYGDVLVGQAQLCVDNSSSVSKVGKLNYDFCHYIYQLERSLFGPTLQLVMEYQDYQRPDITVSFEAQDLVRERGDQTIKSLEIIDRKCLQGHNMISLTGNIFYLSEDDEGGQDGDEDITINCNYCDQKIPCSTRYDYCYLCGCLFCTDCREDYKKSKRDLTVSIQNTHLIGEVTNWSEIRKKCEEQGALAILFWLQGSSSSDLMRDGLIYHQSKLMIQLNKYIPKLVFAKYNGSQDYANLMKLYKIDSFPSLVLCNEKGLPLNTVVGASFYQTGAIYALQQKYLSGDRTVAHNQYCLQDKNLLVLKDIGDNDKRCLACFSTAKLDSFAPELRNKGFFCQDGHYTCINCCYISMPQPNVYRDYTGINYMSSKFVKPAIEKCSSGHKIELKYIDTPDQWQFKCQKCFQLRYVDNEHGIGECSQCKIKYCSKCLGADLPSFRELYSNFTMVRHAVESTAEQAVRCICKKFFKKAYQTRALSEDGLMQTKQNCTWKCSICMREGKEGELHLVCINCVVYNEGKDEGDMANFIVCYQCAKKTKILNNQIVKKTDEQSCVFICPNDQQDLVLTSRAYKNKLTFNCSQCSLSYFGNSERFYCKKCESNYCKNCRNTLENYIKPPKCLQRCPKGDPLKFGFVHASKQLQFCDGCLCALFDQQFACSQHQYSLCKDCVSNNPPQFIGQSKNVLKAVSMQIFKNFESFGETQVRKENKQDSSLSFLQLFTKV